MRKDPRTDKLTKTISLPRRAESWAVARDRLLQNRLLRSAGLAPHCTLHEETRGMRQGMLIFGLILIINDEQTLHDVTTRQRTLPLCHAELC